jgi:uridine kinase
VTARVILLAGPSGSGKSHIAGRSGLPVLRLDDFYKDGDDPSLPFSAELGIVDWDDVRAWDAERAVAALAQLCTTGSADVPTYDLASSRATGSTTMRCGSASAVVAEGVFAADVVDTCREQDILADALVLVRAPWKNFVRRLARDLREHRKPPHTLWQRGRILMHQEQQVVADAVAKGCRRVSAPDLAHLLDTVARTP